MVFCLVAVCPCHAVLYRPQWSVEFILGVLGSRHVLPVQGSILATTFRNSVPYELLSIHDDLTPVRFLYHTSLLSECWRTKILIMRRLPQVRSGRAAAKLLAKPRRKYAQRKRIGGRISRHDARQTSWQIESAGSPQVSSPSPLPSSPQTFHHSFS